MSELKAAKRRRRLGGGNSAQLLYGKVVCPIAAWVTTPEKASMASRPFFSSFSFMSSAA